MKRCALGESGTITGGDQATSAFDQMLPSQGKVPRAHRAALRFNGGAPPGSLFLAG